MVAWPHAAAGYPLPTFPQGYFWHLRVFRTRHEQLETAFTAVQHAIVSPLIAYAWRDLP